MAPIMAEDPDRLSAMAARHASVADKIRALAGAGVARADIARFLQLDRELSLPVLTTDRRWKTLDLGLEVTLIR
jgi:PIN domain nuclease of toxin-antitoxin system